jgi:hypothetical protein
MYNYSQTSRQPYLRAWCMCVHAARMCVRDNKRQGGMLCRDAAGICQRTRQLKECDVVCERKRARIRPPLELNNLS